jgi:hypothetical protein
VSLKDFFLRGTIVLSFQSLFLLLFVMLDEARAKQGDHALLDAGIHDLLKVKALLLGDKRLVVTVIIVVFLLFFLVELGGVPFSIVIVVRVLVGGICRRNLLKCLSFLNKLLNRLLLL